MMMCTRCKKRPAVVFITTMQGNEKKNEGLCLVCAKELGIPQIKEYMDQLGVTDDDLEDFSDTMMDFGSDDGDGFEMGGSGTVPSFIQNLLSGLPIPQEQAHGEERKDSPRRTTSQKRARKRSINSWIPTVPISLKEPRRESSTALSAEIKKFPA